MVQLWVFAAGSLAAATCLAASYSSFREGHPRAGRRLALLGAGVVLISAGIATLLPSVAFVGFIAGLVVISPWPTGNLPMDAVPSGSIDERTSMFSRRELAPASTRGVEYYHQHPKHKEADEQFRKRPGLMSPESREANALAFASADAGFAVCSHLWAGVDGSVSAKRTRIDPAELSRYLLGWARHMGAHSVGIAELQPYHWYSTMGRGDRYGVKPEARHRFALVVTVEMDHALLGTGPKAPTVMESALQYQKSASIAVQLAETLRGLGYSARAHIDGNYQVVCPLVARDAGLGEIGRMGLLMTPDLGPRVRIAVVTTDMDLEVSPRKFDPSMIDFCLRCEKCAQVCPSQAIKRGPRTEVGGSLRWQINQEACFTYWCEAGTDCGRCVAACPYSHPDTWMHRMVRHFIRTAPLFRRIAARADDVLYGKMGERPTPPRWLKPALTRDRETRGT